MRYNKVRYSVRVTYSDTLVQNVTWSEKLSVLHVPVGYSVEADEDCGPWHDFSFPQPQRKHLQRKHERLWNFGGPLYSILLHTRISAMGSAVRSTEYLYICCHNNNTSAQIRPGWYGVVLSCLRDSPRSTKRDGKCLTNLYYGRLDLFSGQSSPAAGSRACIRSRLSSCHHHQTNLSTNNDGHLLRCLTGS